MGGNPGVTFHLQLAHIHCLDALDTPQGEHFAGAVIRPPTGAQAQQVVFTSRKRKKMPVLSAVNAEKPPPVPQRHGHSFSRDSSAVSAALRPSPWPAWAPARWAGGGAGGDTGLSAGGTPARAAAAPSGQALPRPAYLNFPELSTVCKLSSSKLENQGKW